MGIGRFFVGIVLFIPYWIDKALKQPYTHSFREYLNRAETITYKELNK